MTSDWVIDRIITNSRIPVRKQIKKRTVNHHTKDFRRLKFCKHCETVWEILICGSIGHYSHLPTYGLHRKKCPQCKGRKYKTYKEKL